MTALVLAAWLTAARAEPVDLILVLATDVSQSIGDDGYEVQKRGIVAALEDPEVHEAARRCAPRGIALAYAEWSGCRRGECVQYDAAVPFRRLLDAESFGDFARDVAAHARSFHDNTDLQFALRESHRLIRAAPFEASRRVVDVSSGGIQNTNHAGREDGAVNDPQRRTLLARARDRLVADVSVNALVIDDHKGAPGFHALGDYFRELVQGGPGAFTEVIDAVADMHAGLRAKLTREFCADGES